jgi:hypothetical protein
MSRILRTVGPFRNQGLFEKKSKNLKEPGIRKVLLNNNSELLQALYGINRYKVMGHQSNTYDIRGYNESSRFIK